MTEAMASLNDHVDKFLDSDLLFCTVTCSAIFLLVLLDFWFFCDGPKDGDFDQLEDEDYVYNAPLYFSSLFFCLSCFVILLNQLQFGTVIFDWANEIPSDTVLVVAISLLLGALGFCLAVSEFQKGVGATLPLAGKHLIGEPEESASLLEIALEDSMLHCAVAFFTVAIQKPTLPLQLVKSLCKPLVTYIYGPICAPGELLVSNEAYDAIMQELCNKVFELCLTRTQNDGLKRQAEADQLEHDSELLVARMAYEGLELKAEGNELRLRIALQEERQLSSALNQIGMGRDAQKMMAMIHGLAVLNAAPKMSSDGDSRESARLDDEPVTEPAAKAPNFEQILNTQAAENNTALDGQLASGMAMEELAAVVGIQDMKAEESDINKMDEGDNAEIDDSVNLDQPTPQGVAGNKKKKKKKKQRSGRDLKAREKLKELSQKEDAVDAERQALEATWAERCREQDAVHAQKQALEASWVARCRERTAKAPVVAVNARQPAVSTTVPFQQQPPTAPATTMSTFRAAGNATLPAQQQPQAAPVEAANTFQLAPKILQPTREQIWQFNGWQSSADVRLFQPPQQQVNRQPTGQHLAPGQLFQPTQQQTYGQNAGQRQQSCQLFRPPQQPTYGQNEEQYYDPNQLSQPTQQQSYAQNAGQHYESQLFQSTQQQTYDQNAEQYYDPSQPFQPPQQQMYEQSESQQQPPSQYWHEFSGTERQPGQYNLFGPPFFQ